MVAELIRLCAEHRHAAEASGDDWLVEDAEMASRNLESLDLQIRDRSLPPSNGASLGLAKAFGEWEIADLRELAGRIDDYYARVWNC